MPTRWVDWSKTTRSKDYRGSGSFATFLIIGPVCFFLGILFASFPYDFPLLWTSEPVPADFLDHLETHLRFTHQSPPLVARLLHIIMFVCFLGLAAKLFRPSEANVLFDGGSLILYVVGAGVYISNIVKGLRAVSSNTSSTSSSGSASSWPVSSVAGEGAVGAGTVVHEGPFSGELVLGREDSLRVLSASHVILALVLVGVLVLQAGQWYAERKDADDFAKLERDAAERRMAAAAAGGKKKL